MKCTRIQFPLCLCALGVATACLSVAKAQGPPTKKPAEPVFSPTQLFGPNTLRADDPPARLAQEPPAANQAVQKESIEGAASSGGGDRTTTAAERVEANALPASTVEAVAKPVPISQADVEALLKKVNETAELEETPKKEALERLKGALDWLKAASDAEAKAKQFQAEIESVPNDLREVKTALASPLGEPQFNIPDEATLTQIEQQAADANTRLQQAREQVTSREDWLKRRGERKAELTKLIAELDLRLEEAKKLLVDDSSEPTLVSQARRAENEARVVALEKQKIAYPLELKRIDARTELMPLRRDAISRQVAFLEKETAGWQKVVADFRKRESNRQAAEAKRQVQNAHPALKSLAETNATLAEQRKTMVGLIEKIEKEVKQSQEKAQRLEDDFSKMTEKVEKAGNSTTIGLLLRRQREELPDVSSCRERLRFVRHETPKIHLSSLDLQDDREVLADVDSAIEGVMTQLGKAIHEHDPDYVKQMVAELLNSKRDVLDKLIADHDHYVKLLGELELTQNELLDESARFAAYIDERVLWTRSSEPLRGADFHRALVGLRSFGEPAQWRGFADALRNQCAENPVAAMFAVLTVGLLFVFRRRLRQRIRRICDVDLTQLQDGILPTAQAITALAVVSGFWPGLMWLMSWRLTTADAMTELGRACGVGLQSAAFPLWITQFLMQLLRAEGVCERQLQWNSQGVRIARRHLIWLSILGVPLVFLVSMVGAFEEGQWSSSLGRIGLILGCVLCTLFAHCVLRLSGGAFHETCSLSPDQWFCRLRYLKYTLGVCTPLLLSLLAAFGYDCSAQRLAVRFQSTVVVALAVVLLRSVALCWLAMRREQLISAAELSEDGMIRPTESDEASLVLEASSAAHGGEGTGDDAEMEVDQGELASLAIRSEVAQTESQVRYLLRYVTAAMLLVGGYMIWSDVMPALGVLDRIVLWTEYVDLKETVPDGDGGTRVLTTQREVATTLKHAVFTGMLLVLGSVLARSLPALLDVLVFERMKFDRGQCYAARMILRYSISLAAMILACRQLGITWSSIQWLAAAMTVGLGFGLQEIFANLVSGLIILFERPVRVGDLVTVGGVTGHVTRMAIRATTVTDFDRRELVVPNKKFITEDVMNWTLSDSVNRIVIEVGVAYGTDTNRASGLMLKVANRHPLIMDKPEPSVTFDKFGDSSLNLTLRCYLPKLDNRLRVIHEIHTAINREFQAASIEIAFPQQDLHIRSISSPLLGIEPTRKDAA